MNICVLFGNISLLLGPKKGRCIKVNHCVHWLDDSPIKYHDWPVDCLIDEFSRLLNCLIEQSTS